MEIRDMNCRSSLLAASLFSTAVVVAGFTFAADDKKTELGEMMETVNSKNLAVKKGVYTLPGWNKADKKVVGENADVLVSIGKKIHDMTEPAKKEKKKQVEWTKAVDEYIASAENLSKEIKKSGAKQPDAKKAYQALQATCSNCHKDFRKDDDAGF
jgi:cytochrome c556